MIIRSQPTLKDIAFTIHGSIVPRIVGRLVTIALVTVAAVLAAKFHPGIFSTISAIPFTLIGIALSVFMSFRNSACYDRWWEGRKLWGELTIAARSIARETQMFDGDDRRLILRGLCGFAAGLAASLRRRDAAAAIRAWSDIAPTPNPVNAALDRIGRRLLELIAEGKLDSVRYSIIESQLTALSRVQAGCERIASTPVPFAYSLLLHRTALIFCLTLPFALAGSLAWWTLLPVLLVAYTFFGLDALGHQLEDPFGLEPNALPLYAMERALQREMLASLGETELPEPLAPNNYVLL